MPELKCIGGLADGRLAIVNSNFRENDTVSVRAKLEFNIDEFDVSQAYGLAAQTVPVYIYKICKIEYHDQKGPKLRVFVLIPTNWDMTQAIYHMIRCHRPYDG